MSKLNQQVTPDVAVGQLEVKAMHMKWVDNAGTWELQECAQGDGRQWAEFIIHPLSAQFNDYTRRMPVSGRKKNAREWYEVTLPSLKDLNLEVDTDVLTGLFVAAELVPQPGNEDYTTFRFAKVFGKGGAGQKAAQAYADSIFTTNSVESTAVAKAASAGDLDPTVIEYLKAKWDEVVKSNAHLPAPIAAKKNEAAFVEALGEEGLTEQTLGVSVADLIKTLA